MLWPSGPRSTQAWPSDPRNVRSVAVARRAGFRHVKTLVGDALSPSGAPRDTMVWVRSAPGRHFAEPDGPAAGGG